MDASESQATQPVHAAALKATLVEGESVWHLKYAPFIPGLPYDTCPVIRETWLPGEIHWAWELTPLGLPPTMLKPKEPPSRWSATVTLSVSPSCGQTERHGNKGPRWSHRGGHCGPCCCDHDWIPGHSTWRLPACSLASTPSQYYYSIYHLYFVAYNCYLFTPFYARMTPIALWTVPGRRDPPLSSFSRFLPC